MRMLLRSTLMVMVSCGASHCVRESNEMIMYSPLVSLRHSQPPAVTPVRGAYIQVRWCQGDKPFIQEEAKDDTLVEQALAKAHAETDSPYFMDATFYQETYNSPSGTMGGWNPCVILRGHTVTLPSS